jgi:hypothetical protein
MAGGCARGGRGDGLLHDAAFVAGEAVQVIDGVVYGAVLLGDAAVKLLLVRGGEVLGGLVAALLEV